VNNAWNFNGNNRNLNNNNVNNTNQCGAVSKLLKTIITLMTIVRFWNILLDTMFTARKNKRYGKDCAQFEANWTPLLYRMMCQFVSRTFRILRNYAFLTSIPKWREIFATYFEGRLADHLLCDTLHPYIEKELHENSFNNRIGKGQQAAINAVIEAIHSVSEGYTKPCRIIKWDLKGFFPNANCDYMEKCFRDVIDLYRKDIVNRYGDEAPAFLKWLAMICVHCYPARHCELRTPWHFWQEHIEPSKSIMNKEPGTGVPIGRLGSQTGMGLYINDEVRWLNDECGILTIVFMDDGAEIVPERLHGYALSLMPELRKRLAAKGVKMNEKKFYDQPYQHGVEFLGSHIKPHRIHLNNKTYNRAMMRVVEFNEMPDKYRYLDRVIASINSYTGQLKARTDYNRLMTFVNTLDKDWWEWLDWDSQRLCVTPKPEFSMRKRLAMKYNIKHKRNDSRRIVRVA